MKKVSQNREKMAKTELYKALYAHFTKETPSHPPKDWSFRLRLNFTLIVARQYRNFIVHYF